MVVIVTGVSKLTGAEGSISQRQHTHKRVPLRWADLCRKNSETEGLLPTFREQVLAWPVSRALTEFCDGNNGWVPPELVASILASLLVIFVLQLNLYNNVLSTSQVMLIGSMRICL
jgi:hypothetical protein